MQKRFIYGQCGQSKGEVAAGKVDRDYSFEQVKDVRLYHSFAHD